MASHLAMGQFDVDRQGPGIIIVNHRKGSEPDLRYIVHVRFLHQDGTQGKLEQPARAFTSEVSSRLPVGKTISFEFRTSPLDTLESILKAHRKDM